MLELQQELSLTKSELSDARCKLELYSERNKLPKPSRRDSEQVVYYSTHAYDPISSMFLCSQ